MPNPIHATGLVADNPLAVMAALGIMQVSRRISALEGLTLHWIKSGASYYAAFCSNREVSASDFIENLIGDLKNVDSRPELTWTTAVKSTPVQSYREQAGKPDPVTQEWFAAYGSELVVEDDLVTSTPFDMSVARQLFPFDALRLGKSLDQKPKKNAPDANASFHEAIFGPWLYRDDQHSFGWDPSTLKMGAFTSKAPTGMANSGVRAAVWLAFQSLPYFTCCYEQRLQVVSWIRRARGGWEFRWPVWGTPIAAEEIAVLLMDSGLMEEKPDPEHLRLRGVNAIYASAKFKPNKYLVSLRPAALIAQAG